MKKLIFLLIFLILLFNQQTVFAYPPNLILNIIEKAIKELPYNWYYSFNSYQNEILKGITDAKSEAVNKTYFPENDTGTLMDLIFESYNLLVNKLDDGNIKEASYYLGKFSTFIILFSNPYRIGKLANYTLAAKFEALILQEDIEKVSLNKSNNIKDLKESLREFAIYIENEGNNLNTTSIDKASRDKKYEEFIVKALNKVLPIIYFGIMKAINEHLSNSTFINFVYIASLLIIISLTILYIHRKKIKRR